MRYRIPVGKILVEALGVCWLYRVTLLRVLAGPVLLIVLFNFTQDQLFPGGGIPSLLANALAYLLSSTYIAVNCHRTFLLGEGAVHGYGLSLDARYSKFFAWLLALYFTVAALTYMGAGIAINLFYMLGSLADGYESQAESVDFTAFGILTLLAFVFGLYIMARLSLVLPSTAIDGKPNLLWSWRITRGNGARMFLLVAVVPGVISRIDRFLLRNEAGALEIVLIHVFGYLLIAIQVAILSMAFKAFRAAYAGLPQAIPRGGYRASLIAGVLLIVALSATVYTGIGFRMSGSAPAIADRNGEVSIENCNEPRNENARNVCPSLFCKKGIHDSGNLPDGYWLTEKGRIKTEGDARTAIYGEVNYSGEQGNSDQTNYACILSGDQVLETRLMSRGEWKQLEKQHDWWSK